MYTQSLNIFTVYRAVYNISLIFGIEFDRVKKKCTANYPYIRDPTVLTDNFEQARKIQAGIESQIIRKGQLEK